MDNRKMANPRAFLVDAMTAAIGSLTDEQVERAADALSRPGAKFVLEVEHTKTIGDTSYFRRRVYVDVLPEPDADFTIN